MTQDSIQLPDIQLIILNVGVLLLLALASGKLISLIKIPKVTGYLLIGLVLGPSVLGNFPGFQKYILSSELTKVFKVVTEIGLGLIIFNIGGEFLLEHFKKLGKKILWISFFEILFTTVIVTVLSLIVFLVFFNHLGTLMISYSVLLGVVAIATAPAATLLVLREYESEGPITQHLLVLIGLNNIICIFTFKIVFSGFVSEAHSFIFPLIGVFASMALGFVMGLLLSLFEKRLDKPEELLMLVVGGITFNIGFSYMIKIAFPSIHIENLLVNLFMGITLINSTTKGQISFRALKNADLPIYAIFFVLAGAQLHIGDFFTSGMSIIFFIVIYVIGRTFGKIYGSYFGVRFTKLYSKLKNNLGYGLLPQAGVAIGLAYIIQQNIQLQQKLGKGDQTIGSILATVIFAAVMIFELVGPIFTRLAIVRGGEVKEISLSKKKYHSVKRRYHSVLIRLRHSLGIPHWKKKTHEKKITCKDVMRTSVESIIDTLPFDEVLEFATHCKYDQFPVVDKDHVFVGTISYSEIRDILFDPEFSHLIIARDIMNENPPIAHPGNSLQRLLILFHTSGDDLDYLPVVNEQDPPHLIGMVTQKDVISTFGTLKKTK